MFSGVTVVVSVKNEELAIRGCLESLSRFPNVFVVDSRSDDDTTMIVRNDFENVRLVDFVWNGLYPKKKQWCLDNLAFTTDWVLFVDADERISEELMEEMPSLLSSDASAYDLPLEYWWMGKKLRYGHRVKKRVLVRRSRVQFPVLDDLDALGMGELEGHYQPEVDGKIADARGRLIHNDPDPLRSWIDRHNRYADWEAYLRSHPDVRRKVRTVRSRGGGVFDRVGGKPFAFFLYAYVIKLGFLDGRAGFNYAVALSFYYWLVGAKTSEMNETGQS